MLYWQRQCLQYTAPADRVVCVEPEGLVGQRAIFSYEANDPAAWSLLRPFLGRRAPGLAEAGPVLFMHERRTKRGRRLLVVVRRNPPVFRQSVDLPLSFAVTLVEPASLGSGGAVRVCLGYDALSAIAGVSFYAGQADPADESHFTIAYDLDGRRGAIDGRVREDAETGVELVDRGFDDEKPNR